MPRQLVIVESAAQAKTLGCLLGGDFLVRAWPGPVRELPRGHPAVDTGRGFAAEYRVVPARRRLLAELREAARAVETVYLAAEPDREGEALCQDLSEELVPGARRARVRRVSFGALTGPAVLGALRAARELDSRRVEAHRARQLLDRLIGFGLDPLCAHEPRSARSLGLAQAVGLRLVCEREREIAGFVAREVWMLRAHLDAGQPLLAGLVRISGTDVGELGATEAERLRRDLRTATFRVADLGARELCCQPPPPFVTATLLQEAFGSLQFGLQKTMRLAYRLYEGIGRGCEGPVGLITHVRTEATRVAPEAREAARSHAARVFGPGFVPEARTPAPSDADGAPEAIRPTDLARTPESLADVLDPDELALYQLVFDRFVISQMRPAVYEVAFVDVLARSTGGANQPATYLLRAESSTLRQAGFRAACTGRHPDTPLPSLRIGQDLALRDVLLEPRRSEPKARFTEASLLSELERCGCARPATDRSLLARLEAPDCFRRRRGQLEPTRAASALSDALERECPDLVSARHAASFELSLDAIEDGRETRLGVLSSFWRGLEPALRAAHGVRVASASRPEAVAAAEDAGLGRCPECGSALTRRSGRYGLLVGCSRYPACRYLERGRARRVGVSCPRCSAGQVVEREAEGRRFYGCSLYPACRFTSRYRPVAESCPGCGRAYLLEKVTKRDGRVVFCAEPGCRFRRAGPGYTR